MSAWHVKPECINGLTVNANSLLRWLGWSEPDTQCCLVVCLNLKSKWLLHVPSSLNPQTLFQFSERKPPDHCFFINVLPGAQKLRVLGLRSNWFICIADWQSQHQALMCFLEGKPRHNQWRGDSGHMYIMIITIIFISLSQHNKTPVVFMSTPRSDSRLSHRRIKAEICNVPTVGHNRLRDTPDDPADDEQLTGWTELHLIITLYLSCSLRRRRNNM